MRFLVDLQKMACVHVSITLGGRQTSMAQKLLNSTKIRSPLEEGGREAVSQCVRADPTPEPDLADAPGHEESYRSICPSTPARSDKGRVLARPCLFPDGQVGQEGR